MSNQAEIQANEITIGIALGFTGPTESIVPSMASSVELAISEANSSKIFLNGEEKINLIKIDTMCDKSQIKSINNTINKNNIITMQQNLQQKKGLVKSVFDTVYNKYDLMNDFMSLGVHRYWKKELIRQINPSSNDTLVDVACGTGDIAKLFSDVNQNRSKIFCVASVSFVFFAHILSALCCKALP